MILLLWATAWADPVALRAPWARPAATVGLHEASAGGALGDEGPWLAAHGTLSGGAVGASVGQRWVLRGDGAVRRIQAGVSGGLAAPLVVPGVALTGTGWVHGGWVGPDASFVAGAAVPIAVGTGGLRLPVLLELQGGVRLGPVALGARLAAGPVWTPGLDVATWLEPSLSLQLAR